VAPTTRLALTLASNGAPTAADVADAAGPDFPKGVAAANAAATAAAAGLVLLGGNGAASHLQGAAMGCGTLLATSLVVLSAPRPVSALTAMLVSARAAAAAGQERVRVAALLWQRERDVADTLARQIAEAEQLLTHDGGATSSSSTGHLTSTTTALRHDPADPHVSQLHY
jgi:hypothetical protein